MKRRYDIGRPTSTLIRKIFSGVLSVALVFGPAIAPDAAFALPHGGMVSKGKATLAYSTSSLLVTQSTSKASFDWSSYNVKSGQSVVYKTPGSTSVSMNFIGGTQPAQMTGSVRSNGILEFMDANGIIFGSGSAVSAAGVMAFGSATPWGTPTGPVTNAGTIVLKTGGTAALVGSSVANSGTIDAPGGTIILAAGTTVVPIVKTGSSSMSVATTGGGTVDVSGILSAETANGKTGSILLQSGMGSGVVSLDPTAVLDASAPTGGNGGNITIDAAEVVLDNAAPIDVSAPYGTKGTVTIDPNLILYPSTNTLDVCNAAGLETIDGSQTSLTIGKTTTDPLKDTIALESNINLATRSPLYAWTPLGTSFSLAFTGTFNGNGHTVSGYKITASTSGTGFVGYLGGGGIVENLGVEGTVNGGIYSIIGGVVGNNGGTVKYSYNTGAVDNLSSGNYVGGVVGENCGTVEYSYNTGAVQENTSSLGTDVGGVVGINTSGGTVKDNYFDCASFTGSGIGSSKSSSGAKGLEEGTSSGELGYEKSYSGTGWSFASGWNGNGFNNPGNWIMGYVSYNFPTCKYTPAPILVSDLPSVTVTVVGGGKSSYSGSTFTNFNFTQVVSMGGSTLPSSEISASAGPNAGTYTVTPKVPLSAPTSSSTQTLPIGSYNVVSGTYTITPKGLSFGGDSITNPTKPYDGTTTATLTPSNSSAVLSGFVSGQGATYSGATGIFASANAGKNVPISATLSSSDFSTSTVDWNNYALPTMTLSGTGTITPVQLSLSTPLSSFSDGSPIALTASNTALSGMVSGQTNGAGLAKTVYGVLSSGIGSNVGGTVSLDAGDLTGDPAFLAALAAGDYLLPATFSGGTAYPLASSPVIPAAQVNIATVSLFQSSSKNSGGGGSGTMPSFDALFSASFESNLVGGVVLNTGDLMEDSANILDITRANNTFPAPSSDETIYAIDSGYITPVQGDSGSNAFPRKGGIKSPNKRKAGGKLFDATLVSGSSRAPYSLQVLDVKGSTGGVFESGESP